MNIFFTADLFPNGNGAFSTRHAIGYWFRKTSMKAGITNLVFHDTRRTFYTRMTFLGCKYLVLEYLMGHKLPG